MLFSSSPSANKIESGKYSECLLTSNNKLTLINIRTKANKTAEVSIELIDGIKRRIGTNTGLVILTKNCENGLLKLARAKPSNRRNKTAAM